MYCLGCRHHLLERGSVCPECGRAYDPDRPRTFLRKRRSVTSSVSAVLAALLVGPVVLAYLWTVVGLRSHFDGTGDGWAMMGPSLASYVTLVTGGLQALLLPFCWRRLRLVSRVVLVTSAFLGMALLPTILVVAHYWL